LSNVRSLGSATLVLLLVVGAALGSSPSVAKRSPKLRTFLEAQLAHVAGPKEREVTALRRPGMRVFDRGNGTFRADLYAQPVDFKTGDGVWRKIDNTLVASPAAGYAYRNAANRYRVDLPRDLSDHSVRVAEGDRWVSFALRGARGEGKATGATARFDDAFRGVDVAYSAQADSVKETLTWRAATPHRSFGSRFGPATG
jgi:hypothetical protein